MERYVIDRFLLDKFQKLSDKLQWLTGKDNFWFSKITLLIHIIIFIFEVVPFPSTLALILVVIMYSIYYFIILLVEYRYRRNPEFGNKASVDFVLARYTQLVVYINFSIIEDIILFIIESPNLNWSIYDAFFQSFILVSMYLFCCTPKPPCKSKIREIIEAFKVGFSQQRLAIENNS